MGNMDIDVLINDVKQHQPDKLFMHSMAVASKAVQMAKKFNVDEQRAFIAGILHDYAKKMSGDELLAYCTKHKIAVDDVCQLSPFLLHGAVAADIANKKFGIDDDDILNAICYHTYGRVNMSDLEKIIYVADAIADGRDYPDIDEIRNIADKDLNKGLMAVISHSIKYILDKGMAVHPNTILLWNDLVKVLINKSDE